jgi:hypothetical protein
MASRPVIRVSAFQRDEKSFDKEASRAISKKQGHSYHGYSADNFNDFNFNYRTEITFGQCSEYDIILSSGGYRSFRIFLDHKGRLVVKALDSGPGIEVWYDLTKFPRSADSSWTIVGHEWLSGVQRISIHPSETCAFQVDVRHHGRLPPQLDQITHQIYDPWLNFLKKGKPRKGKSTIVTSTWDVGNGLICAIREPRETNKKIEPWRMAVQLHATFRHVSLP